MSPPQASPPSIAAAQSFQPTDWLILQATPP